MCKANVALTHEVFHLGAHSRPEHALAKSAKAAPQANVTRVSERHKLLSQGTGDKQARSAEYQVPLNNQCIKKLEERAQDWITLMNASRPTF